jgi:hypothetical protein
LGGRTLSSDLPLVLQAKDVQKILGVSKGKTHEIMNREDFPTIHLNKWMIVTTEAFFEWLSQDKLKIKRRPIYAIKY